MSQKPRDNLEYQGSRELILHGFLRLQLEYVENQPNKSKKVEKVLYRQHFTNY